MKFTSRGLMIILFLASCLLTGVDRPARAESPAMEKLLEILEKKGTISSDEVEMIRRSMARDQERLSARTRQIEKRERDLENREKVLQEKEDAMEAGTVDGGGEMSVKEAGDPGEGASDKTGGFPAALLGGIHRDGFCFQTSGPDPSSLCLGGLLQADYRHFNYRDADPAKNKFDLRRARLSIKGSLPGDFDYKFEYEFQGAGSRRLLDAYVDVHRLPYTSLRIGQFKEPFGLEQSGSDRDLFFAERSMGDHLAPGRDVGLMVHASLLDDRISYGMGLFNGDGPDDSTGGDVDSPQFTGRVVLAPFRTAGIEWLGNLQVGGSLQYASIDRNNVDIHIKTAGLTPFFDVSSSTKFNIIREADVRVGHGAELGWSLGPVALSGEYIRVRYRDVMTSAREFDIDLRDYYISLLWMVTGETPMFRNGVFQPVVPDPAPGRQSWGALGLAFRWDVFETDDAVYDYLIQAGASAREAKAYSLALTWIPNSHAKLVLDASTTRFDRPLLIDRDPRTGEAVYSEREDVFTGRFQLRF